MRLPGWAWYGMGCKSPAEAPGSRGGKTAVATGSRLLRTHAAKAGKQRHAPWPGGLAGRRPRHGPRGFFLWLEKDHDMFLLAQKYHSKSAGSVRTEPGSSPGPVPVP